MLLEQGAGSNLIITGGSQLDKTQKMAENSKTPLLARFEGMPGRGFEPRTRGFSILCSTN
jgi:hypothetical protein